MQIKIPFSSQNVRTLQASTNSLERKTALISKGVLNKYNIDIEALSETLFLIMNNLRRNGKILLFFLESRECNMLFGFYYQK